MMRDLPFIKNGSKAVLGGMGGGAVAFFIFLFSTFITKEESRAEIERLKDSISLMREDLKEIKDDVKFLVRKEVKNGK